MPSQFLRCGRPLDEAAVAAVEEKLGYRLPSDYRTWIVEHNGGVPRPGWLKQDDPDEREAPACWLHVDALYELENPAPLAVSALGMRTMLREGQPEPVLPERLLPIGAANEGYSLLLSLSGADAGHVYYWGLYGGEDYWEIEHDEAGEPADTELHLLARSFAEFLARLTEAPEHILREYGAPADEEAAEFDAQAWLTQLPEEEQEAGRLHMLMAAGTAESARQAMDEGLAPEKVLMMAEMFGNRDLADAARERLGDKVVWPAAEGFTAAFWSDAAAVRERLAQGAPVSGPTPDDSTPLHGAAAAGSLEVMRLLLDEGADHGARDARGKTPLHCAATGPDRAEAVGFLLERGAPPGVFDHDGELALHKAAGMSGCLATMKRLIDAGEDLHARAGFSSGPPVPEGTSDLMRGAIQQLTSMGDPFQLPPPEDSDPEMRELFEQLSQSPMAQFARRITADPEAFVQQHQLQMAQGRTAAEVLQMRLVPSGDRMVPGTEILGELDAYQRRQSAATDPG